MHVHFQNAQHFLGYLMQGQIALHCSTAQYLSLVRGDVVSESKGLNCWKEAGNLSLSLSELRLIVGVKHLDNEPN